jgi:DNA-binding CsgD family transcriptional regulator
VGEAASGPSLRKAVAAMLSDETPQEGLWRWSLMATTFTQLLWDYDAHTKIMTRLSDGSRESGALNWLALTLRSRAVAEIWTGHFDAADALYAEALDVGAAADEAAMSELMDVTLCAWRGRDAATRATAAALMRAADQGLGAGTVIARSALVVLTIGRGQYREALEHAAAVFDTDVLLYGTRVLPSMIEAAVRVGDGDAARRALNRFADRVADSESDWALGLLARSEALLADDDAAEALYQLSLVRLGNTTIMVELARAHLLYGEWLRRRNRRTDARDELRIAFDMFAEMGADAFAGRARDELLATGERARKRTVETLTDLTPQEAHVARLAAAGDTNAEIAAQLFIGSSTVEYHLRKVFRKLSVTSRRQLKRALNDEHDTAVQPAKP